MLQEQGCVFQERHGWERPGWFNRGGPAPVRFQHMHRSIGQKLFCGHCDTYNPLKPLRSVSDDYWLILSAKLVFAIVLFSGSGLWLLWCLWCSQEHWLQIQWDTRQRVYVWLPSTSWCGEHVCLRVFLASVVHKNFLSEWLNRFVFSI